MIALTATATPKVQSDIVKNLNMEDEDNYVSSFNRDNLYYEVRPKGKKDQVFNRIHVDDIAGATAHLARRFETGIFNVTDDAPSPIKEKEQARL